MEKQKKRSEIDNQFKWDLTTIFKSDEDALKALDEASKEITEASKFEGHLLDNSDTLLEYLKWSENVERKMYKVFYYAHLKHDEDTTNTKSQELYGKISLLLDKYSEISTFTVPELMKGDFELIERFIKDNPLLEEYRHTFHSFYRAKGHTLSFEEERILSLLSEALDNAETVYKKLTDSDMKFGTITDENGKEVEFTESKWSTFVRSQDRRVRKDAFKLLYKRYGELKNTIASTFAGNIEVLIKMAKIRKYGSSLEAALFHDNVTPDIYNNLIESVHNNLDALYDYYAMKKEILGLDEMHLYDIYVDLDASFDKNYSLDEAKELIFKALEPMGEEYLSILHREFDEHWIDFYNNEGKRGGAYSSGFYDTNPFILTNYEGKLDDVSTLIHESGHSMHTYLSCHNQTYANSNYSIFVAEVASTVNEMLLRLYLLNNSNDDNEKKHILNEMLELFKSTIYRQTMFAEFERDMHKAKEDGEILTHEYLSNKYYDLNKLYFGDSVCVDEDIKYEWERIPHFYYNFYVYKYVIGLAAACQIATRIYNHEEGALEGYLKFLSSGGSDYPVEELKLAGVDVTDPHFMDYAAEMFRDTIKEYRNLMNKGVGSYGRK